MSFFPLFTATARRTPRLRDLHLGDLNKHSA
jgi:hypothetical protein